MSTLHSTTLEIDADGLAAPCQIICSPNKDDRPVDTVIDMIVIHNISLPPQQFGGEGIIQLFTNQLDPAEHSYYATIADLKVSSHFLIRRQGELMQFVSCNQRAWHAGVSSWQGKERCNDFSIGIELEGCDESAFDHAQYLTLQALIEALKQRYPIKHIVGHSDIAPGRKTDPGPFLTGSKLRALIQTKAILVTALIASENNRVLRITIFSAKPSTAYSQPGPATYPADAEKAVSDR
jgi:AmpD protein